MVGCARKAERSTPRSAEMLPCPGGLAPGTPCPYLRDMSFWRNISPRRAVSDFAETWHQPTPHRWKILGVAVAATGAVLMTFIPPNQRVEPARPEVTYITSWSPDRTREEIVASNLDNQRRQDERRALLEKREEVRKDLYRAIGEATFVDVDAMEAEIEAERAAEAGTEAGTQTGAGGF